MVLWRLLVKSHCDSVCRVWLQLNLISRQFVCVHACVLVFLGLPHCMFRCHTECQFCCASNHFDTKYQTCPSRSQTCPRSHFSYLLELPHFVSSHILFTLFYSFPIFVDPPMIQVVDDPSSTSLCFTGYGRRIWVCVGQPKSTFTTACGQHTWFSWYYFIH